MGEGGGVKGESKNAYIVSGESPTRAAHAVAIGLAAEVHTYWFQK